MSAIYTIRSLHSVFILKYGLAFPGLICSVRVFSTERTGESVLGWDNIPGGAVELEGEDDVISVAYLTDEAALGAEVAEEHMVGGVLHQSHQVG